LASEGRKSVSYKLKPIKKNQEFVQSKKNWKLSEEDWSSDIENTRVALCLKIKQLTNKNRQLEVKNTLLKNRVTCLEDHIASIAVCYFIIGRGRSFWERLGEIIEKH